MVKKIKSFIDSRNKLIKKELYLTELKISVFSSNKGLGAASGSGCGTGEGFGASHLENGKGRGTGSGYNDGNGESSINKNSIIDITQLKNNIINDVITNGGK